MAKETKPVKVTRSPSPMEASEEALTPPVDIYQTDDEMTILVAEVPGAIQDKCDVRVDKGVLTIEAEGSLPEVGEEYACLYAGFTAGKYYRAFALSDEVDREQISASLQDGVLTVKLPRAAAAKTRKIEVKAE